MTDASNFSDAAPAQAMILTAGLGTRMRPLTDQRPKPLVEVMGRSLIDHLLDRLAKADIRRLVVNLHYFADQLEAHLHHRDGFDIRFSDERAALLDTGGGVCRALPLLGASPFFILNTDSLWTDAPASPASPASPGAPASPASPLTRLAQMWRDQDMDCLLLLARRKGAIGYDGAGDFHLLDDGRLRRRGADARADHAHTGVCLIHPRLFAGSPEGAFSLNLVWDKALAAGRLFGAELQGQWMHIGDPAAVKAAGRWLGRNQ